MPYKIKLVNGNKGYVVSASGTKLSNAPLPLMRAKKQLIAVNIAHARKKGYIK